MLFSPANVPYADVIALSGVPEPRAIRALAHLVDTALVTLHQAPEAYFTLEPVCASFLSAQLHRGAELSPGVTAAKCIRDLLPSRLEQLLHAPDADAVLHLLNLVSDISTSPGLLWQFMRMFASQFVEFSRWPAWREMLHKIIDTPLDASQIAWARYMLGVANRWLGELDAARQQLTQALENVPGQDISQRLATLVELSVVSRYQARWDEAQDILRAALEQYKARGEPQGVAQCVHELAQLALEAEHPAQTLAWLSRLPQWDARNWGLAAQAYLALGDAHQALDAAERALHQFPDRDPNRARMLALLGQIVDARGDSAAAVRHMLSAIDLLEQHKDMLGYARACNNLAIAYRHLEESAHLPDAGVDDIAGTTYDLNAEIYRLLREAEMIQEHVGDTLGLAITRRNMQLLYGDDEPDMPQAGR